VVGFQKTPFVTAKAAASLAMKAGVLAALVASMIPLVPAAATLYHSTT